MNYTFDITLKTRNLFLQLLETLTLEELNKQPKGFNNTIFWNIKHVVITQQLLTYSLSGLPVLISETEIESFRKGTKSEGNATREDLELLKSEVLGKGQRDVIDTKNVYDVINEEIQKEPNFLVKG